MSADYSSYKVSSGEVGSSSKFDNLVQAVQDSMNAVGDTSKMAWAAGAIIDPATQIKQNGATNGQALAWNGSGWVPTTVGGGGGGGGGDTLWTHDIFTADVPFTAVSEAAAIGVKTTTSKTYDGNPVFVDFFCARLDVNSSTVQPFFFVLLRDTTVLVGKWGSISSSTTVGAQEVRLGYRDTPSAAAHTYTVKVYSASANGGTVRAGNGGSGGISPGYLRVFKDS